MTEPVSLPPTEQDAFLEYAQRERDRFIGDLHRPRYHLTAPSGWLNDPNGIIHYRGQYHLFYQYNPLAARWGAPYWGHVVSEDLVSWRDLPPALRPDALPADDGGCWSGCTVEDGDTVHLFYTGVKGGEQATCVATSDAELLRWQKDPHNPLIRAPQELNATRGDYRDPYVWREADGWYQLVGTSVQDKGSVLLYRSDDLIHWDYLHPFVSDSEQETFVDSGQVWECPSFIDFGEKQLLVISRWQKGSTSYSLAFLGRSRDHRFYPEPRQLIDYGQGSFYAPLLRKDAGGRVLAWGWLQEQRPVEVQLAAGWSGVMSLPRVLSLEAGKLEQRFAPELISLRDYCLQEVQDEPEAQLALSTSQLELTLTLTNEDARQSVLELRFGDEHLTLTLDWQTKVVAVVDPRAPLPIQFLPIPKLMRNLELHLYLDGSTLELIANTSASLSTRLYPRQVLSDLRIFSRAGGANISHLGVWQLKSIW